jgi:cell division protease FtsH
LFLQARLNGVGGDLARATQLAFQYIAHWGMGDGFFSAAATMAPERIYTDPVTRREVEVLLRRAYAEVRTLLEQHRAAVIAVAEALLQREELESDEILALINHAEAPGLAEIAASALNSVPVVSQGATSSPAGQNGRVPLPGRVVEGEVAHSDDSGSTGTGE